MSEVLVECPPICSTFMRPALDIIDTYEAIPHNPDPMPEAPPLEDIQLADELACMASQHPVSGYNVMKFGPAGSPMDYTPVSIQSPAQVREVKARQAINAVKKAWWPANPSKEPCIKQASPISRRNDTQCQTMHTQRPIATLPRRIQFEEGGRGLQNKFMPLLNHPPAVDLQLELSVAMSSSLSLIAIPQQFSLQSHSNLSAQAKTSESHPINISAIVPPELLPLIATHLEPRFPQASRMFNLPPSLMLHHSILHNPHNAWRSHQGMHTHNGNKTFSVNGPGPPNPNVIASFPSMPDPSRFSIRTTQNKIVDKDANKGAARYIINSAKLKDDPPGPARQKGFVELIPNTQQPFHAATIRGSHISGLGSLLSPPPFSGLVQTMSNNILGFSKDDEEQSGYTSIHDSDVGGIDSELRNFGPPSFLNLGNMLLSSCPGKKVRLFGPVRGRGAICRDLGQDFRRIKSLGVDCIICCLDDEELEFLGAPWPQYSASAHSVGLDILRIPIPEGFAPLAPALLDQQLSHIIQLYTIKGIHVLVHCRGGVGRAGLVACCWILKLGLCGWLMDHPGNVGRNGNGSHRSFEVNTDCLELVQRVIGVVRARRSPKAIETYEQVKFLVDFVEFMRANNSDILSPG